ncbi:CDGSH iron-sulfur domain-containing protein [Arthrobacter sp. L77]|uniref:CDGSH iron-sulfur domain-containing protein n=1 Tax=Arthrobacter sp. L77 TaxID=1496689 RepID=UPI0009E4708D
MDADRGTDAQDTEDTRTDHPLNSGTAAPVSVVACTDGPLLVRGDFTLLGADGEELPRTRRTVALCRCGASVLKPYCDGSHKLTGFRSEP